MGAFCIKLCSCCIQLDVVEEDEQLGTIIRNTERLFPENPYIDRTGVTNTLVVEDNTALEASKSTHTEMTKSAPQIKDPDLSDFLDVQIHSKSSSSSAIGYEDLEEHELNLSDVGVI